ncbi:unnamed protein product [Caenorhabditis brenneri]
MEKLARTELTKRPVIKLIFASTDKDRSSYSLFLLTKPTLYHGSGGCTVWKLCQQLSWREQCCLALHDLHAVQVFRWFVAGSWFPGTQRAIAISIGVMSNPLGVLMEKSISPAFVKSPNHVIWLNSFTSVPLAAISEKTEVSPKSDQPSLPPRVCAALIIFGSAFGAAASAAVILELIPIQLTLQQGLSPLLVTTCLFFGALGLATYPIGLELESECIFPVFDATSTEFIVLSGQIQDVFYVFIVKIFARLLQPDRMYIQK